ncbi:MAG: hypothetical protein IT428_02245 [Planctomycetaceae bacterium]|nr:hypothetical protein [Planctomycetaceae bacterium]
MKTLAYAILAAVLAAGSTGCCCGLGHGGCCSYAPSGGGCCTPSYGYAPSPCNSCGTGYAAPYGGGCPSGNCGVGAPVYGPQGANFGPMDTMTASSGPAFPAPVAMGPSFAQTAMAPLQSLPTY